MILPELNRAVWSYGVHPPIRMNEWWVNLLQLEPIGQGHLREYTGHHVRLIVSARLWSKLLGQSGGVTRGASGFNEPHPKSTHMLLLREAISMTADNNHDWVKVGEGHVSAVDHPTPNTFINGAALLPVPNWRH